MPWMMEHPPFQRPEWVQNWSFKALKGNIRREAILVTEVFMRVHKILYHCDNWNLNIFLQGHSIIIIRILFPFYVSFLNQLIVLLQKKLNSKRLNYWSEKVRKLNGRQKQANNGGKWKILIVWQELPRGLIEKRIRKDSRLWLTHVLDIFNYLINWLDDFFLFVLFLVFDYRNQDDFSVDTIQKLIEFI